MSALREAALDAVVTRLAAQITTATVERMRRGPVDTDKETLPVLIVGSSELTADDTVEFGSVHYTMSLEIAGYARATTSTTTEAALADLHASIVAALDGWTPSELRISDPQPRGVEFRRLDAEESNVDAGEMLARFEMLIVAPTGVFTTA
jgi:hypothetical protein